MNGQDLKNSILQLAIQGKLVEQREEEGTARELLEQIQEERKKLVKEGKIKKTKPLPEITEDEIPFDIPESWEWVRYNDFFEIVGGSQPPKSYFSAIEKEGYIRLYQIRDYGDKPVPVYVPRNKVSKFTQKGDILLARYGASVGKVFFAEDGAYNVAMAKSTPLFSGELINRKYMYFYFLAPLYQKLVKQSSRSAQAGFNKGDLDELLIPLPPLQEQKRIVAKIEELKPYVDQYDKAYSEVEDLNKKFLEDMQKSILQYAIQGKLVKQREEEGTAEELYRQIQEEKKKLIKEGKIRKQKALPEITEDEIPFDIPESWKWVRLIDLSLFIKAGGDKPKDFLKSKTETHTVPVIANGIQNDGIIGYTKEATVEESCITVSGRGTIGFSFLRTEPFTPVVRLLVLNISNQIDQKYIQNVLSALLERGVGTSIKQLTVPMIEPKLIPLPPLEEQKRIVARIEELLPYTKQLVK